ncbi:MAG: condensation domain-containing protein [Kofleriaceae bacterium]
MRNSALRTRFRVIGGRPYRVVDPLPLSVTIEPVDLGDVADADRDARLHALSGELTHPPFDLTRAPLLRAALVHPSPRRHALIVIIHHAVFDGGSAYGLFHELRSAYRAVTASDPDAALAAWPHHARQYIDVMHQLVRSTESDAGRASAAFWDRQLHGAPPLALPTDFPRDRLDARREVAPWGFAPAPEAEAVAVVPDHVRAGIGKLARDERATPFMVLLDGFAVLLRRTTGQDDLCFQSTYSLRNRPELAQMVGLLGNSLVLRIDASGNPSMRELIRRTRNMALMSWTHGQAPLLDRTPHGIRRMNFNYLPLGENLFDTVAFADGLTSTRLRVPSDATHVKIQWDINLWLLDTGTTTRLRLLYVSELFRPATIKSLLGGYVDVLSEIASSPDRRTS